MRWDGLRVSGPGQDGLALEGDGVDAFPPDRQALAAPPLPLALAGGVRRTFDTPGFAGMVFYEVQAKTIINKVPGASQVPFQWTINPYRGCSHACVYCLVGETPILMADGRTKPLSDLRVGDRIYGTEMRGRYRRYVPTTVLAHWRTVKPAYRVRLDDGTTLVTSADHRFLTDRGWKHVTGTMSGDGRRPHLRHGNKLIGVGAFEPPPKVTDDYRRGYLCGMIRGDAILRTYRYATGTVHRFRLALADVEALDRSQEYLAEIGIETTRFEFAPATDARRRMYAIRTSRGADIAAITTLIGWPREAGEDWTRGFLAGIFDAEGSRSRGILRISSSDPEIVDQITEGCARLGIATVRSAATGSGVQAVLITGGLGEHLRFYHATGPAITRKWDITDAVTRSAPALNIASIEPLHIALPMFDITTGTGDFIADGVVSHNCFARKTHEFLDFDSGRDFDTQVVVKVNAGTLLRRELGSPRWRGEHIAMGTNVDVYQRAEGRYQIMPQIISALRDFANPFSILTKGTLILRDLGLLREAASVTNVGISFSVGFLDETVWRSAEPGTPSPRRRLDAVRALTDAGFDVSVLMAPILPGLTDTDESIDATVRAIAASGAISVVPLPLHLRTGAREWYLGWLERTNPGLHERYRELFRSGAYLPEAYQRAITAKVRMASRRYGVGTAGARQARHVPSREKAQPDYEQLTLL